MALRSSSSRSSVFLQALLGLLIAIAHMRSSFSLALPASRKADGECPDIGPEEVCCAGRVYEGDSDRFCCPLKRRGVDTGDKVYVFRDKCSKGYTDDPMERCTSSLADEGDPYDIRIEGCCGGRVFNRQKQKCCFGNSGTAINISRDTVCCNGHPLTAGQLCCKTDFGPVAVNKSHPSHTHCCEPSDPTGFKVNPDRIKTYDDSTDSCHPELGVLSLPESIRRKADPTAPSQSGVVRSANVIPTEGPEDPARSLILTPADPKACLTGREKTENGEQLECCDGIPYAPSKKKCCVGVLNPLPSGSSECCYDRAFAKGDPRNPCLGECGGRAWNKEYQACCKGKLFNTSTPEDFCCGSSLVNPAKQTCCGGMVVNSDQWRCCKDTMPFDPEVMRCNRRTGAVTVHQGKAKKQSIPRKFCERKVDTWDETWRSLIDDSLIKVQGRVERCGIRLRRNTLTIPLSPVVALGGGQSVSSCLQDPRGFSLVLSLPHIPQCRRDVKDLKEYLSRQTLEVMVPLRKLECPGGGRGKGRRRGRGRKRRERGARIRLGEKEVALVLRSRKMDSLLEEASLSERRGS